MIFFFVSDEFNQVAWFSSNRETKGDTVMVYTIKWDGSQVRNMAEDANHVSEEARLLLEGGSDGFVLQQHLQDNAGTRKPRSNGAFSFEINDTLIYTHYSQFLNTEALTLFKEGHKK